MVENEVDFIIIGQGIAGTLVAHCLRKQSKSIFVIDNNHIGAASKVAAGIINPIIGKQFSLSWKINDLLPVAVEMFTEIGELLGKDVFKEINLVRSLKSVEEENSWLSRTGDSDYSIYMQDKADVDEIKDFIHSSFSYGEVKGSIQVNLPLIIEEYKELLISEDRYLEEKFNYNELIIEDRLFEYQGIKSKHIVFCEGVKGVDNPFFNKIGFVPAKGEALLIKIPNATFTKMYKNKLFLVRIVDDVYWCGGGYEWNSVDDLPTEEGKQNLINELNHILKVPYEIIDHKAAIRPTVKSRLPLIMENDSIKNMFLLNGLGTKGTSIGPLAAKKLVNYMLFRNKEDLLF